MSKPFLAILTNTFNEAPMVPWFLRYYGGLADLIIVYDDHSRDGTRELLAAHPKVQLENWTGGNGIDEYQRMEWVYRCKQAMVNQCEWLMIVDFDEFIFGPYKFDGEVPGILKEEAQRGTEVIQTTGFNLTGPPGWEGLPRDDGRQLWEHIPIGVWAPIYAKPIVVRPEADVRWNLGRHALENCKPVLSLKPRLKLLHYRYLGPKYTAKRNARNLERCCVKTGDKSAAWSCEQFRDSPQQEGTSSWSTRAQKESFNVMEIPI